MKRYLEVTIHREEILEQFLRKQLGFTKAQIRHMKYLPDGLSCNGERCRVNRKLQPGDCVRICLETEEERSPQIVPYGERPELLYEDDDLLVVNKPAGLVVHPQGLHYQDTLTNRIAAYYEELGQEHKIRSIGRLDRETSGLVLFAKNKIAAQRLQRQRQEGTLRKTYLAVAAGTLPVDGQWHRVNDPLTPDPRDERKMCVDRDGKTAATWYQVVASDPTGSVLKVWLETGRTHQIRVHMAHMGHPLLGDQLYGISHPSHLEEGSTLLSMETFGKLPDRAALHAWQMELKQPFTQETLTIQAPIPDDLKVWLGESL